MPVASRTPLAVESTAANGTISAASLELTKRAETRSPHAPQSQTAAASAPKPQLVPTMKPMPAAAAVAAAKAAAGARKGGLNYSKWDK